MSQVIELAHLEHTKTGEIEIAGLGCNFAWMPQETEALIELWTEGLHFADIAKKLKRKVSEVLFWLGELDEKDRLPWRRGGLAGRSGGQ